MDRKKRFILALILLVILIWLVSPTIGNVNEPLWILPRFSLLFDSDKALQITQEFVTRFPRRVLGTFESRQSAEFLMERLESLGYKTGDSQFDALIAGHREVGRNVLASRPGQVPETLVVIAHYDTAPSTIQGAADDGSGIGVLLELARVLSESAPHRGLLFVASDGEGWGMLGALDLARHYPDRRNIAAVLSLDSVCAGSLGKIALDLVGQFGGYTPPWLRQISRRAAEGEELLVVSPFGFEEYLERSLLLSWTGQGPFLNAGIPSVNLRAVSRASAGAFDIYQSPQDTVENLEASSFKAYGRVAEKILRTLEWLPSIPRESMQAMRLRDSIFLSSRVIAFLHYLTFLPLLAVLCLGWYDHRKNLSFAPLFRELLVSIGLILPFLAVYCAIVLFRLFGFIPSYDYYPPPPHDPLLVHPYLGVLGGLLAVFIASVAACNFLFRVLTRRLAQRDFWASRLILLSLLITVCLFALQHNSYWALTFIAFPAWIWTLVGVGENRGRRVASRIMILGGGVPCIVVHALYAARLGLGWKLIWYEVLALSTGMLTTSGYLLGAATVVLGIRFLAIQTYRGEI